LFHVLFSYSVIDDLKLGGKFGDQFPEKCYP
jgi:hypothetical protein